MTYLILLVGTVAWLRHQRRIETARKAGERAELLLRQREHMVGSIGPFAPFSGGVPTTSGK